MLQWIDIFAQIFWSHLNISFRLIWFPRKENIYGTLHQTDKNSMPSVSGVSHNDASPLFAVFSLAYSIHTATLSVTTLYCKSFAATQFRWQRLARTTDLITFKLNSTSHHVTALTLSLWRNGRATARDVMHGDVISWRHVTRHADAAAAAAAAATLESRLVNEANENRSASRQTYREADRQTNRQTDGGWFSNTISRRVEGMQMCARSGTARLSD